MHRNPSDPPTTLQKCINAAQFFNDLRYAGETAPNALFGKLKDGGFGIVKDFLCRVGLLGGTGNGGIGSVDQSPQQGLITNYLDVVLDTGSVGRPIDQR